MLKKKKKKKGNGEQDWEHICVQIWCSLSFGSCLKPCFESEMSMKKKLEQKVQ